MSFSRYTVDPSHTPHDTIVVFLIGMHINALWKPWLWIPVALAMTRMLKELAQKPNAGLLSIRGKGTTMVQYWDSIESLHTYAADTSGQHYPAWANFNRKLRKTNAVGVWHETFVVHRSDLEAVYVNTPPEGLAKMLPTIPAHKGLSTAKQRLQALPKTQA